MTPALALDGTHKLALRPYQVQALAAVAEAESRGIRRQLGVAATGLGKTCMFVALAEKMQVRTLILAHRDELIAQAVAKVRQWWPDADVGVVKAERNETWAQDVVVASVQSLSPARVARLGKFGLVVVDEAHHCGAPSYGRVLESLGAGAADGPLLLGVTATPDRADGKGLDKHFDEIVFTYDILWGIRAGYLCDLRAMEVTMTDLHLETVAVTRGDYAEGQLGQALTKANAPRHIVRAWKEHAAGRMTAVFTPTIVNAEEVAAEFTANGISAACVSGVDLDTRRRILRGFDSGRIQVVTNAAVLTEGWDCPPVSCIVQARPTKSRGLYTQIVGRGVRPWPGKDDCLVLDVVGNTDRIDLCTVPSLAGITKKQMSHKSLVQAVADVEEAAERARQEAARKAQMPRVEGTLVTRSVSLFKQVAEQGKVAWAKTSGGGFAVSTGTESVLMEPDGPDTWTVLIVSANEPPKVLMAGVPLALAQGIGEDQVRRVAKPVFVDRQAKWRGRRPSQRQLDAAARWRIKVDPTWTSGELSNAIDARVAESRRRKFSRT